MFVGTQLIGFGNNSGDAGLYNVAALGSGAAVAPSSGNTSIISHEPCTLDSSRFVAMRSGFTGSGFVGVYATVVTMDDSGTITFGTEYRIDNASVSASSSEEEAACILLDTDRVLFVMDGGTGSGRRLSARIGTISGSVITLGTELVIGTGSSGGFRSVFVYKVSTTLALIGAPYQSGGSATLFLIKDTAGTLSIEDTEQFTPSPSSGSNTLIEINASSKYGILSSDFNKGWLVTVSGSTISIGSLSTFSSLSPSATGSDLKLNIKAFEGMATVVYPDASGGAALYDIYAFNVTESAGNLLRTQGVFLTLGAESEMHIAKLRDKRFLLCSDNNDTGPKVRSIGARGATGFNTNSTNVYDLDLASFSSGAANICVLTPNKAVLMRQRASVSPAQWWFQGISIT